MANYSKHQERIIKNYYKNRDAISLQKAQELVTDLYLAEGKKRQKCWERLASHLEKLEVPAARIKRLVERDDAADAAKLVQELMG